MTPIGVYQIVFFFIVILAITAAIPMFVAFRAVPKSDLTIFTREGVRALGLRSTVGDDYLPPGADKRLTVMSSLPAPPGYVAFRRWMFPVWRATADGRPADVVATPGGAVAVRGHDVRLMLVEPRIRTITKIITALTAIVLGLGVRRQSRRSISYTP